ncbi:epimerase [Bacillus manliponensis]|uniref:Epimerase n=1 Tax=Bacillus manliponensis TaxID=574376 RepID=A0A073K481_9BACI|nr:hypothetical protein [Bacillus manliponensis]KEK21272.1 epimerase [Bacillus manliponensis]
MDNQNKKGTAVVAAFKIVFPLLLPILVPSLLMIVLKQWMPDEIVYPGIMSLVTLCIWFFVIGILFTLILNMCKLSEAKLKELGFLGITISTVASFLTMYVGYFWLADLNVTSVQMSPNGILIVAGISAIVLEVLFRFMDDDAEEEKEL